jgi:hypothetical protein
MPRNLGSVFQAPRIGLQSNLPEALLSAAFHTGFGIAEFRSRGAGTAAPSASSDPRQTPLLPELSPNKVTGLAVRAWRKRERDRFTLPEELRCGLRRQLKAVLRASELAAEGADQFVTILGDDDPRVEKPVPAQFVLAHICVVDRRIDCDFLPVVTLPRPA